MRLKRLAPAAGSLEEILAGRVCLDLEDRGGKAAGLFDGTGALKIKGDDDRRERARRVVVEIVREAVQPYEEDLRKAQGRVVSLEKELQKLRASKAVGVPGLRDELTRNPFLFSRAIYAKTLEINGVADAWERHAPHEREVIEQGVKYGGDYAESREETAMRRRTVMQVGDDSLGGFWVPEDVAEQFFVESLLPATVLGRLPVQRLSGLTANPIKVPKETGDLTAVWVGETDAITESNVGAGDIQFRPHELGALVKLTAKLLREASINTENFVRMRIANRFARALDLSFFKGLGSDHEPLGLFNYAIQAHTATADPPTVQSTWTDLVTMISKLEESNVVDTGNWRWVFHSKFKTALRRMMTGDGTNAAAMPFWTPNPGERFSNEQPLAGYPHAVMNQLATNLGGSNDETEVVFGDFSLALFLQWAGFEVAVSSQTSDSFAKRQVWVRAIQEVDHGPLQESAFVLMNTYDYVN